MGREASALSHDVGEGQSESAASSSKDAQALATGPFVEEEDAAGGVAGRCETRQTVCGEALVVHRETFAPLERLEKVVDLAL